MSHRGNFFVVSGATYNPFAETTRITTPSNAKPAFEVYAGNPQRVRAFYDAPADRAVYLWGIAVHASGKSGDALLSWISATAEGNSLAPLRELQGHFIAAIEDRRRGTVLFIPDVLGLRPWYVGSFRDRLVAGSDVPSMCSAGLSAGEVDYDAVASWLQYNFDCTGGSIVRDFKRLAPGAVSTYDPTGRLISEKPYASLEFAYRQEHPEELLDTLQEIASRSFDSLVNDLDEVTIPLSGGYDSRYIAALASRRKKLRVHLITVETKPWETPLAQKVAHALGQPLRVIDAKPHVLDLFDDPFAFDAAGFPSGRNLTCAAAGAHTGAAVISGFLGDRLMRSTMTRIGTEYFGKDEQKLELPALVQAAHGLYQMKLNRLDVLDHRIETAIKQRALNCMMGLVERGAAAGKALSHADLFGRHRFYLSNIFYHHLDDAEALLPFYSWKLLNPHTSLAIASYRADKHERIFGKYFPEIAGIPHNHHIESKVATEGASRHLRRWARGVLAAVGSGNMPAANKRKILSRLPSALLGSPKHQTEILFVRKLLAFTERLRACNLRFDPHLI